MGYPPVVPDAMQRADFTLVPAVQLSADIDLHSEKSFMMQRKRNSNYVADISENLATL
jgi:hypothetical protein